MVELFGGHRGGFIASSYADLPGIGVMKELDGWSYEAFLELLGADGVPVRRPG